MTGDNLSKPVSAVSPEIDPALIETFLLEHPAFFKHHPDILMALELPHGGPGAVSLVERQVALLRERNIEMRSRLAQATDTAESNDVLFTATRQTLLDIIACRESLELADCFTRSLQTYFSVEASALLWFDEALTHTTLSSMAANDKITLTTERAAVIKPLLKNPRPFCVVCRSEEMAALFPGLESEGSAAIAPLVVDNTVIGLIAVGSEDVHRYDASVGTLFLTHIADVIVRLQCLRP